MNLSKTQIESHIPRGWRTSTVLLTQPLPRKTFIFRGYQLAHDEIRWIRDLGLTDVCDRWGLRKPHLNEAIVSADVELFRFCGFQGELWCLLPQHFYSNVAELQLDTARLFEREPRGCSTFARAALQLLFYPLVYSSLTMARPFCPAESLTRMRAMLNLVDLAAPPATTFREMILRYSPLVSDEKQISSMNQVLKELIFRHPMVSRQFATARQLLIDDIWRPHSVAFFTIVVAIDILCRLAVPGAHGRALEQWAFFANCVEKYMIENETDFDDEHDYWEVDVSDPQHPFVVEADRCCSASTSAWLDEQNTTSSASQTNTMGLMLLADSCHSLWHLQESPDAHEAPF